MTATDVGWRMARTAFAAAIRSRSSYAASASSVSAVGNSTSTVPGVARRCTGKPLASEDLDHPMVLRQHVGMERGDAGLSGGVREVRDQDRPEAAALERVGDADADLRAGHVAFADVLRTADHLARPAVGDGQQREVVPIVDLRGPPGDLAHVDRRTAEAEVAGLVGEADQVVLDPLAIVGARRPDAHGGAIPKDDVDLPVQRIGNRGDPPWRAPTRRCPGWWCVGRGTRPPPRAGPPRAWRGCWRRSS